MYRFEVEYSEFQTDQFPGSTQVCQGLTPRHPVYSALFYLLRLCKKEKEEKPGSWVETPMV